MAKTNRELADQIGTLGHHEREVIEWVIDGLSQGRHVYGGLNLETDQRDWRVEMLQEVRDALVYAACKAICVQGGGGKGTHGPGKPRTNELDAPGDEWLSLAEGSKP